MLVRDANATRGSLVPWLVAITAVACGGHDHRVAPAEPHPAAPAITVAWDVTVRTATCRRTGTTLSIPVHWQVRATNPHELTLESPTGAAMVRSGVGTPSAIELVLDVATVHQLATGTSPDRLDVREVVIDDGEVRVRYAALGGDYRMLYQLILRNGSSCRIAVLVPPGHDDRVATALLDGITDSAWADTDLVAASGEDPAVSILRGLLTVGMLAIPGT